MSENTTNQNTATTSPAPAATEQQQTKALAPRPPATPIKFGVGVGAELQTWEDAQRVAAAFASSRYFRDVNETAQALVKITMGSELGFSPMASMLGIYIIEGRPAMSSAMINAVIRRSGRYRFEVKRWDEEACALLWRERVDGEWLDLGPSSFTIHDAQRAGLTGKGVWKSYPKAMLWARALTQGARAYTPDLFFGAPVYTPDELGEQVVELPDGTQVIEAPSSKHAPAQAAQRGVAGVTAALAAGAVAADAEESRPARKAAKVKAKDEPPITTLAEAAKDEPSLRTPAEEIAARIAKAPVVEEAPAPAHPSLSEPPPAPSSSSATTSPAGSSTPPSATSTPTDTGDESEPESPDSDDDPLDAIDAATASPGDVAFAKAVRDMSADGVAKDTKRLTAIVVDASTKVSPAQKQALRMFTRALFNRNKGVATLTSIDTVDDRAALALALAVDGNAIGTVADVVG